MKKLIFAVGVFLASIFMAFTSGYIGNWNIQDDYTIKFSGRGANGTFKGLQGTIQFTADDLAAAKMDVTVAVQTIDTGNKTKNKHAQGEQWFYAEKYPTIRFQSKEFTTTDLGYMVMGDLTMRGTTKSVEIPFDFLKKMDGGEFIGSTTINRQDFGIEGPFLAFTVGDEFLVELKVPVAAK